MVVVVLLSNMSLAIWLHGLLLTWEKATYSQQIYNSFDGSMVCKNGVLPLTPSTYNFALYYGSNGNLQQHF